VLRQVADRIRGAIRPGDTPARLIGHRFALCLGQVRQGGMEVGLSVTERLQAVIAEPIAVNAGSVYVTASVGFCLARRALAPDAASLLQAAEIAMDEARRAGPGSVRAFSGEMAAALEARTGLAGDLRAALEEGQIRPWFQPQVDARTGLVTGFEALVRWHHPQRGVLPPGDFLDTVETVGLTERMGEVVLFHALTALREWDLAGLRVPRVGVNFTALELRNPRLADRIRWELDRFDLTPDRLTVEVLETVVSEAANDSVVRNIAALATLGCDIDLDDFGTGHASITNIRRFAVSRIKIDRSFVTHVDSDPNQKKMVAAILSMADQLGLATLAEGVETPGEHRVLARMGCETLQGYGIGRPMPFEETADWMRTFKARQDSGVQPDLADDRA
jgi:predicted signal transduction protein with EAL and GGDEF domain